MRNNLIILICSSIFACRDSVKLDENDGTIDTAATADPGGDPGGEPGGEPGEEPSTEPGGEPSGEPGEEPSSEPSGEPTSEPAQEAIDADGDGYVEEEDCDDGNAAINPDADELCDGGIDNNCDGVIDDDDPSAILATWYLDADGDGYGDESYAGYDACTAPPSFVSDNTDCDDTDAATNPAGSANELDPTLCMTDADGDGYGDPEPSSSQAAAGTDCDDNDASNVPTDSDADGYSGCTGDCDDSNADVNPGAKEAFFDGLDNDCDGKTDEISSEEYDAAVSGAAEDYLSFDNSISATDVNGDNRPEVFVGGLAVGNATDSNSDGYIDFQGAVYMLDGADYTTWDGDVSSYAQATIYGDNVMNYFAAMTPTQSDIDGDGTIDLAIGGTDAASVFGAADVASGIFYNAANLSGDYYASDADVTFSGTTSNFGAARLNANLDLNGDGYNEFLYSDFITGYYDDTGSVTWYNNAVIAWWSCFYGGCDSSIYLYDGAAIQNGSYSLEEDATVYLHDEIDYDYSGQTITGGDIDGDGKDELIVAVPGADLNIENGGCIFLFRGSDEIVSDPNYGWDPQELDFYFDNDNASICGETVEAHLGWNNSVQLGDINGDGDTDLVVAAAVNSQVFVFYSVSSLFGQPHDAETDADVVITAAAGPGFFGYSIAVGDIDGDGKDDIAVSAPDPTAPIAASFQFNALAWNGTPANNGIVYLFDGSALSSTMSEADATGLITSEAQDLFGMSILATDINVDGKTDLLIGAPMYDTNHGRASLYVMP